MAYDLELANRLRESLAAEPNTSEKAMFGGLAFMINGNLAVSVSGKGGLLLRVGPAETDALAAEPHAERAVMGGRTMNGWLRIDPQGLEDDAVFDRWVRRGVAFARTLTPK